MARRRGIRPPRLRGDFPFRDIVLAFLREYSNCDSYWYVPKARSVSDDSLEDIAAMLQVLDAEFADRVWDGEAQSEFLDRLIDVEVVAPTSDQGTQQDQNALPRILKVLLGTLGLARVDGSGALVLTPAGIELATVASEADREDVVVNQVAKIQWPQYPGSPADRQGFSGLLPLLFLLQVLQRVGYRMSATEWILFLNLAQAQDDADRVVRYIRTWRDLSAAEREELLAIVEPVQWPTRAQARETTVRLDSSYQIALLAFPEFLNVDHEDGQTLIRAVDSEHLDEFVEEQLADLKIATYESEDEWIGYFGDPELGPDWLTYLLSAIDAAESADEADEILDAAGESDGAAAKAANDPAVRRRQREKQIEDYYYEYPEEIEEGLWVVEGGRQFQTGVGPIDLLCVDSQDRWVVVEIKVGEAEDAVFGQVLRYMGWIHRNFPDGERNVRSIILCGGAGEKAKFSRIGLLREDYKDVIDFRIHGFKLEEV
jgi:hypothetical protein